MKIKQMVPEPKSRFLKVKCLECGNEQVVFGCSTTTVKCLVCEKPLLQTTGGKAKILTKIIDVLS
ncbi:MAG TPA: 30S ribosomal protein S27e [Candidatus Lokiarchaeia archaeon]|nr:30S ribosomal protein S27e [Candidatus Lokiarchaeia archaeon]HMF32531.1 30S ribosomal protein S27e [Candidatus Lokiarchaeia archaeon]